MSLLFFLMFCSLMTVMRVLWSIFISHLKRLDWFLLLGIAILGAFGLITLLSVNPVLFQRQLIWYALFTVVLVATSFFDWRSLSGNNWFRFSVYWASVALLILVYLQGTVVRGTRSWITVGGMQFEPAEFAKIGVLVMLAGFFSRRHSEIWRGKNILYSLAVTFIPVLLILFQPDLGSAFVFVVLWFGFIIISRVHLKRIFIIAGCACIAAVLAWMFLLRPYQKERVYGFLFPERDPLGAGYNVNQSKIAIGSAGLLGKGFGMGTQSHLKFLPEAETDFIFAAFVEEWGVLGGMLLLLTFFFVLYRVTTIGLYTRNTHYQFLSLGCAVILITHVAVNIGSTLGLMPVTGIPLSFVSYGGSHLLTVGVLIGIMQRIKIESGF